MKLLECGVWLGLRSQLLVGAGQLGEGAGSPALSSGVSLGSGQPLDNALLPQSPPVSTPDTIVAKR